MLMLTYGLHGLGGEGKQTTVGKNNKNMFVLFF